MGYTYSGVCAHTAGLKSAIQAMGGLRGLQAAAGAATFF
jgi:hypothetical protein